MTSMRRLQRDFLRWQRYAAKVAPGWQGSWCDYATPPGALRAWARHDKERIRRNLAEWASLQAMGGTP